MKTWQQILFGLLCGLLAAGAIILVNRPPRGSLIELPGAPEGTSITVDVSGAVANPGVYTLPISSRVEDAVSAAGGLLPEAYTSSLNMAAVLSDGSKVLVPVIPTALPPGVTFLGQPAPAQASYPININTAGVETLTLLPGIGETKAQAIIDFRTEHGPFTTIEDIQKVSGIGPATFEKLKDLITVY